MLLQFTFENYKSFKDEATLDMIASSIKEHESDVAVDAFGERVLKVAAIFGANASGKSNIFKAFKFMINYVKRSLEKKGEQSLTAAPFAFVADLEDFVSSFEVLFSVNSKVFQYGFRLKNHEIIEEYLYEREQDTKKEKYSLLFYRRPDEIENLAKELEPAQTLLELADNKVLFLSILKNFKFRTIQEIYTWFEGVSLMNYGEGLSDEEYIPFIIDSKSPLVNILKTPYRKKALEKFVRAIDSGIEEFGTMDVRNGSSDSELGNSTKKEKNFILTFHKNIDDNELSPMLISHESSGTRKLIALYVHLEQVLQSGGVLFADELDAKLHPLLLRYLITMFHDPATNPKNAQLIFTTHDVFTLDKDNFRRDEIWFVDKDDRGVSELYSLAEYKQENGMKTRNDASYGKDYILGKYNAIPNLKRLTEESVQDVE